MGGFHEGRLTVDYVRVDVDRVKAMFGEARKLFEESH